jgi:hypothetical protein
MHCPICGQKQVSENIRFCSRCGFLLTGITELVANHGVLPNYPSQQEPEEDSPRRRGVKQGLMILLVGMLLIVPLLAMLHVATNTEPFVMAIAAIISFWGGILRMVYAWLFESKIPGGKTLEQKVLAGTQNLMARKGEQGALPPHQSIPAGEYFAPTAGSWRETNDLAQPGSVTDHTTRTLKKMEEEN